MEAWARKMYGNNAELYHFGIPGMKWGVRKQRPTGNGRRRTGSINERLLNRGFRKTKKKYSGTYNQDARAYKKMSRQEKHKFIRNRHLARMAQNYVKGGAYGAAAGISAATLSAAGASRIASGKRGGGALLAAGTVAATYFGYKAFKESVKFYGNAGAAVYNGLKGTSKDNALYNRYEKEYGKKK